MICSDAPFTQDGYCEFCGTFMQVEVDETGRRKDGFCNLGCQDAQLVFENSMEVLWDP